MMRRVALVLGLLMFSQPTYAAKVTLDGFSSNRTECPKTWAYDVEIQGNFILIKGQVINEKVPISAAGTFDAVVRAPGGGQIRFIGDTNTRKMESHQVTSHWQCKWGGTF